MEMIYKQKEFELLSKYKQSGVQLEAIDKLVNGKFYIVLIIK